MNETSDVVGELRRLFHEKGGSQYGGESVSQLEHALQAASIAETEGADSSTIVAALLHDVGHLLHDLPNDAPEDGVDDVHEKLANDWLVDHFPREVTEPVRMHVESKRYLCTVDPSYSQTLSEPSLLSLKLQGGLLSAEETQAFENHDLFEQNIYLRRLDDRAKDPQMKTPDIEHFLEYVAECVKRPSSVEASE